MLELLCRKEPDLTCRQKLKEMAEECIKKTTERILEYFEDSSDEDGVYFIGETPPEDTVYWSCRDKLEEIKSYISQDTPCEEGGQQIFLKQTLKQLGRWKD